MSIVTRDNGWLASHAGTGCTPRCGGLASSPRTRRSPGTTTRRTTATCLLRCGDARVEPQGREAAHWIEVLTRAARQKAADAVTSCHSEANARDAVSMICAPIGPRVFAVEGCVWAATDPKPGDICAGDAAAPCRGGDQGRRETAGDVREGPARAPAGAVSMIAELRLTMPPPQRRPPVIAQNRRAPPAGVWSCDLMVG